MKCVTCHYNNNKINNILKTRHDAVWPVYNSPPLECYMSFNGLNELVSLFRSSATCSVIVTDCRVCISLFKWLLTLPNYFYISLYSFSSVRPVWTHVCVWRVGSRFLKVCIIYWLWINCFVLTVNQVNNIVSECN